MATQAAKGQQAIADGNYEEAITQLTAALSTANSPLWLINRSTAYQRMGKYDLALADADNAYLAATQRARRELMATAQFRRAVSLHGSKRYGDARLCLAWCRKLNEKEKALGIWQAKVAQDYEAAEKEGKSDLIACTVKEVPDPVTEVSGDIIDAKNGDKTTKAADTSTSTSTSAVIAQPQTPVDKVRHEWYQSNTKVTITIFAKGVNKEQAEVVIEEGSLEVRFPTGESGTYDYTVSPLFSNIDPASSEFRITPHKIEINLHKVLPGKWNDLEGTTPITPSASFAEKSVSLPNSHPSPEREKVPVYPTSSRTGPKDWDTLASKALQADRKEGDAEDDDDENGDATDVFFKKLYKDADPDTRRAMMKSYQESNGTALSTNWADVKKGPVETKPPEGLVAKKWGE